MTVPSQQAGKTWCQVYSVGGEANDAWSQLSSLKVFQSESCRPTLDLVDAVNPCGQQGKSRKVTFHDAKDLEEYLASNPMIGGTRFM